MTHETIPEHTLLAKLIKSIEDPVYGHKHSGKNKNIGEEVVAHWTMSQTKNNIGTSFTDIYDQTNADGKSVHVDFTGQTQYTICINWNKIGTGTQTVRCIDVETPTNILFIKDVISGHNDVDLTDLPTWAKGQKKIKLQAKSTVDTDNPVFEGCQIRLK